jgi:hypothetical protein
MSIQDAIETQDKDVDSTEFFNDVIKSYSDNEPEKENPKEKEMDKEEVVEEELEETLEEKEDTSEKKEEESTEKNKKIDSNILGKTPEEIDELIDKRTQEAVQKHEVSLRELHEAQTNEVTAKSCMQQLEQTYSQYEQSIPQIENMLEDGQITTQQYKQAINQAVVEMQQLRNKYAQLQQYTQQTNKPKIKHTNDMFYQKLQTESPDYKDSIVQKYATNLKEKVYDVGGIDMAQGGFKDYVRDFLVPAIKEGENRGYQKAKNEIQKQNAKAKAKSVVQDGDSRQTDNSAIRTADDILNASKDALLSYVLD